MDWYIRRIEELKKEKPLISLCGDDCAVCPRYLAKTKEELRETAEFWYRAGWRERVVSEAEIRCEGCENRSECSLMLAPCVKEHGVARCSACEKYCCGRLKDVVEKSYARMQSCKDACETDEEFEMFVRAFYEKEKNL